MKDPKSLLCNTIFSNKLINSLGSSAIMNAYTVQETSSALLLSGKAADTTYSIIAFLWGLSGVNTCCHNSNDYLSTKYLLFYIIIINLHSIIFYHNGDLVKENIYFYKNNKYDT